MKKMIYTNVVCIGEKNINWGEDALITYPAVCMADSMYVSNKVYYNYRLHETSSTHKSPSSRIDELENFYVEIKRKLMPYDKKYLFDFQIDAYMKYFFDMFIMSRFGIHCAMTRYLFPYSSIPQGSRVQIYGAGDVGKSYVCELLQSKYAEIVGWYDNKANDIADYAGVSVDLPEKINKTESDIVLIAIQKEKIAKIVENELEKMGIETGKIFWTSPKVRF